MKFECAICGRKFEAKNKYDLLKFGDFHFGVDIDEYEEDEEGVNLVHCPDCLRKAVENSRKAIWQNY